MGLCDRRSSRKAGCDIRGLPIQPLPRYSLFRVVSPANRSLAFRHSLFRQGITHGRGPIRLPLAIAALVLWWLGAAPAANAQFYTWNANTSGVWSNGELEHRHASAIGRFH